ncbi:hypothetical protein LZ198_26450 [Myxococcus sp. K15C18031901]|uniref:hypothetical protein n=1 Tax=Myxococcus dinghuensis TaxID=2906761 RepID=UPI0020A81540|nr:hypothetical protein [Myxococcus dinghuensis]MCP3102418.1 hypothetical protein [Myxococcus dinghuensis]
MDTEGPEADTPLERELDLLMRRQGLQVPTAYKAGVLAGYEDLRRMTAHLRQPRDAESEPANVFQLDALLRGR